MEKKVECISELRNKKYRYLWSCDNYYYDGYCGYTNEKGVFFTVFALFGYNEPFPPENLTYENVINNLTNHEKDPNWRFWNQFIPKKEETKEETKKETKKKPKRSKNRNKKSREKARRERQKN